MELMTKKQKEVLWKKERLIALRLEGLTHPQIQKIMNEELMEKGLNQVSLSWVKVNWHRLKNQKN